MQITEYLVRLKLEDVYTEYTATQAQFEAAASSDDLDHACTLYSVLAEIAQSIRVLEQRVNSITQKAG